jgi:hypothetical protein
MAGTAADREAELARINRSESNNYNEFKNKPSASEYNKGFNKDHRARDPNNASADTPAPNGRG